MIIKNWKLFLEEFIGNNPISNYDTYISDMNKTLKDKMFFIDEIKFDVIVDFGCADGSFLYNLSKIKKNVKLIGYDLDNEMLNKAKNKLPKNSLLTDNWNEVINELSNYKYPLLNLSSVIHEVYSYSSTIEINRFWEKVFKNNFKFITIRDMIPSLDSTKINISNYKEDAKKLRKKANLNQLYSFEKRWGSINNNYRNFIHFLLKYKYTDNWDREVNEDYLPITLETMIKKIPNDYKIIYESKFVLPFLKNEIKKDFNIDLIYPTHIKMIIKKV